jgi:hypothetical protein
VRVADEPGDARRVPDHRPRVLVEVHADEHVAGDADPVHELALAVLDLDHVLHRDLDLEHGVLLAEAALALLDVLLHALLEAGVGVDDVPLARLGAQLATELLVGVERSLFGLVVGRRDRRVRLVDRVDLERLVHERVGLGVRCLLDGVEDLLEVVLVVAHDVDATGPLGRVALLAGAQDVALLDLADLGVLLFGRNHVEVAAVVAVPAKLVRHSACSLSAAH